MAITFAEVQLSPQQVMLRIIPVRKRFLLGVDSFTYELKVEDIKFSRARGVLNSMGVFYRPPSLKLRWAMQRR